jgi:hypothetical protein
MSLFEILELKSIADEYNGIKGLKDYHSHIGNLDKSNQKLRDELATVKAQLERERHIVDALIGRREGF